MKILAIGLLGELVKKDCLIKVKILYIDNLKKIELKIFRQSNLIFNANF